MGTTDRTEAPRYRARRLRRPDERIEFQTTNLTRPADRFVRRPAPGVSAP